MASGKRQPKFKIQFNGFAYVLLLVAISIISTFAANALQIGSQLARRDAEKALQIVGLEFEQALFSYANSTPANSMAISNIGAKGPRTLDELLKDTRFVSTKRHLRQLHADPLTGLNEWGVVKDKAGFILGIYSLALGKPIQQVGFTNTHANFENASSYSGWIFGLPTAHYTENQSIQIAW